MAAGFAKNEVTAAKRRCLVVVYMNDGYTLAPRSSNLSDYTYVGQSDSDLIAAVGTMTNVRRPLVVADDTFTADNTTEQFTAVAHGLETGDGPIQVSTSGTLPAGLAAATDYWIINVDNDTFKLASSLADAYAGTAVAITDDGTGTHTLADTADTERGLDGYFIYEATQNETNFDGSEFLVVVSGGSFLQSVTTVNMLGDFEGFETTAEGAHTYGDIMRLIAGIISGKSSGYNTGTIVFKSLDGSKTRATFTVDSTGRLTFTVGDLT